MGWWAMSKQIIPKCHVSSSDYWIISTIKYENQRTGQR